RLLLAAMTQPAPRLATVMPDAPPAIAAVVDRALSFDQRDRFPDAGTMARALREAAAAPSHTAMGLGGPAVAPPPPPRSLSFAEIPAPQAPAQPTLAMGTTAFTPSPAFAGAPPQEPPAVVITPSPLLRQRTEPLSQPNVPVSR